MGIHIERWGDWKQLEVTSNTAAPQQRGRDTANSHAGDGGGAVKIPKLPSNASSSASARPLDLCPGFASSPQHLAVSSKSHGGEKGRSGGGGGGVSICRSPTLKIFQKRCLSGRALARAGFDAYARSAVAANRVEQCSLPLCRCVFPMLTLP